MDIGGSAGGGDGLKPSVTFIVPCFKLAHLLPECVNSILMQTYDDFEILIMDDCSPDNTAEVTQAFQDPRVKHIRHEKNLGHLRNYNVGIERSQGKYVWLISADDRFRSPKILEKFIGLMEAHPEAGYVFCPGVGLENGQETEILAWTKPADRDAVWNGREFLKRLAVSNAVLAPSGMVRRTCYEKLGGFPEDLPYSGDWYLWCLFALHYDVGYFAEPMVNYRLHDVSMTHILGSRRRVADNVAVRWRMRRLALEAHANNVADEWLRSLGDHYAYCVYAGVFGTSHYAMTLEEFEQSVAGNALDHDGEESIRGRVYTALGDGFYQRAEADKAMEYYKKALRNGWMLKTWIKRVLAGAGKPGAAFRRTLLPVASGNYGSSQS